MSAAVEFLTAQRVFAGKRFALQVERFATPDGEQERAIIHHPGSVAIIAQPQAGQVLLVRQYRYAIQRETLEIPAGTRESGEDPAVTAARELIEETGYRAGRLQELCRSYSAIGICDELQYLYQAFDLSAATMNPDAGEFIAPEIMNQTAVSAAIESGLICDTKTILALQLIGFQVGITVEKQMHV